jgi:hypothetical protein
MPLASKAKGYPRAAATELAHRKLEQYVRTRK